MNGVKAYERLLVRRDSGQIRRASYHRHVGKEPHLPGGELEYAVLSALFDCGSASGREIHERVGRPGGLVYTTIAKVLDRLFAKRLVRRKRVGKAFVYRPNLDREVLERARARDSLKWLAGPAPLPAMATLVDAVESLDPNLLDELAKAIAEKRKRRGS